MKGNVKLRYCIVGEETRNVSDFAGLGPKQRPESFCPECKGSLVLKLGDRKTHHAAHKAENLTCSLTHPEGALHFNTKSYIYEQLKKGNRLLIKQECPGWNLNGAKQPCSHYSKQSRAYLWLENWDDVLLEKGISDVRPDIVFYRNNEPIAAVEIFVTNAVDEKKKAKLFELGLPWIEVKAEGEIFDEYFVDWAHGYDDEDEALTWSIEKPLTYHSCHPAPEKWICAECEVAPEKYAEKVMEHESAKALRDVARITEKLQKRSDELEDKRRKLAYTVKKDNRIILAKAIVQLKPYGETELFELFVVERDNSEPYPEPPHYRPQEIYLRLGRSPGKILVAESPVNEKSKKAINDYYKIWLRGMQKPLKPLHEVYHLTKWVTSIAELDEAIKDYKLPFIWIPFQHWVKKDVNS